ncbi:MAG: hypothetical protein Greene041662_222 [Candidatus Peregrinibacteria bacterium Greene0416_62]|nr:MAG: hypothetical protein Greene041662_222 [Candidatus Peregrinibacteria bacterium Greene0416_62]TSC98743.1 MAG: hypothetical protein Greene101449_876 [Candidatus Peregrinibacteria bacterium Greene1014_49]
MRRSIGMLSTLTLLATPFSAFALAASPSALLPQLDFKGNPHAVESEFRAAGNGMHAALWMKGAQEGKTPATTKAWWKMTMDMEGNGMQGRVKMAAALYQSTLYFKVMSVDGNLSEGIGGIATLANKPWMKIPIPSAESQTPSFTDGWAAGMRQAGAKVSDEDVQSLVSGLFDALFTLESTRYQGGTAYSLMLAPDYLHRAMRVIQFSAIGKELGMEQTDLPKELPMNFHIRVNTNSIGELTFLKWYAATTGGEVSFVGQGKSQWQASPVYVEVPGKTIPWEEFSKGFGMEDLGIDEWKMPSMDTDTWETPMKKEEDDWSEEEFPRAIVRPPRRISPRVRQMEAPRMREGCTATLGTAYYVQLARKGVCDLPPRSTYRVNDTTR